VAHLITSRMLDFIELDDDFAIAKTRAPRDAAGRTLAEIGLRTRYGVTVVGVAFCSLGTVFTLVCQYMVL
jgi:trk system potassium uptake protein